MRRTRSRIARNALLAAMACTLVLCGCHRASGVPDAGQDATGNVTLCDFDQCRSTCGEQGLLGHCNFTQCECYPGPSADADVDLDSDVDADNDIDVDSDTDTDFLPDSFRVG